MKRQTLIKDAIIKTEQQNPLHEWSPKQLFAEVRKTDHKISYRRLLSHLKKLIHDGIVRKTRHGHYLSRNSLVWKEIVQDSLINDVIDEVPKLGEKEFENLVARNTRMSTERIDELRGKNFLHFLFLRLRERLTGEGNRLENAKEWKNAIESDVRTRMNEDLRFIENATNITILSSQTDPHLDTWKLRAAVAEVLYYFILHERYSRIPHEDFLGLAGHPERMIKLWQELEKVDDPKTFLNKGGISIMIKFDPKQVRSAQFLLP